MELRCENGILFGIVEDGVLEVKCRSRRCGHEVGAVVIHRFDLTAGNIQGTLKFKDPSIKKEERDGTRNESSLRSA